MVLPKEGYLLRIFIGESDQHQGIPLYEWLVRKAREEGLAGATVLRGVEGFGAHSRVHTAKILRLSADLPIIVEIVDTLEKVEAFFRSSTRQSLKDWPRWKECRSGFTEAVNKTSRSRGSYAAEPSIESPLL